MLRIFSSPDFFFFLIVKGFSRHPQILKDYNLFFSLIFWLVVSDYVQCFLFSSLRTKMAIRSLKNAINIPVSASRIGAVHPKIILLVPLWYFPYFSLCLSFPEFPFAFCTLPLFACSSHRHNPKRAFVISQNWSPRFSLSALNSSGDNRVFWNGLVFWKSQGIHHFGINFSLRNAALIHLQGKHKSWENSGSALSRPARPLNWLSIRRASCRSVPIMQKDPPTSFTPSPKFLYLFASSRHG